MAEKTKNMARGILVGLFGSMVIIITTYYLMALTLFLMQRYKTIDIDAPFSVIFEHVEMSWAQCIISFGALNGMTIVLMVSVIGQARYLAHIIRAHMFPPWFEVVHEKKGTSFDGIIIMVIATTIITFSETYISSPNFYPYQLYSYSL